MPIKNVVLTITHRFIGKQLEGMQDIYPQILTMIIDDHKYADFIGDRERIRTAGLPLRSVQRTSNNIERAGFPGFTFLF